MRIEHSTTRVLSALATAVLLLAGVACSKAPPTQEMSGEASKDRARVTSDNSGPGATSGGSSTATSPPAAGDLEQPNSVRYPFGVAGRVPDPLLDAPSSEPRLAWSAPMRRNGQLTVVDGIPAAVFPDRVSSYDPETGDISHSAVVPGQLYLSRMLASADTIIAVAGSGSSGTGPGPVFAMSLSAGSTWQWPESGTVQVDDLQGVGDGTLVVTAGERTVGLGVANGEQRWTREGAVDFAIVNGRYTLLVKNGKGATLVTTIDGALVHAFEELKYAYLEMVGTTIVTTSSREQNITGIDAITGERRWQVDASMLGDGASSMGHAGDVVLVTADKPRRVYGFNVDDGSQAFVEERAMENVVTQDGTTSVLLSDTVGRARLVDVHTGDSIVTFPGGGNDDTEWTPTANGPYCVSTLTKAFAVKKYTPTGTEAWNVTVSMPSTSGAALRPVRGGFVVVDPERNLLHGWR